jgi:hypothetical protein
MAGRSLKAPPHTARPHGGDEKALNWLAIATMLSTDPAVAPTATRPIAAKTTHSKERCALVVGLTLGAGEGAGGRGGWS